jgi:hypothetical protein
LNHETDLLPFYEPSSCFSLRQSVAVLRKLLAEVLNVWSDHASQSESDPPPPSQSESCPPPPSQSESDPPPPSQSESCPPILVSSSTVPVTNGFSGASGAQITCSNRPY